MFETHAPEILSACRAALAGATEDMNFNQLPICAVYHDVRCNSLAAACTSDKFAARCAVSNARPLSAGGQKRSHSGKYFRNDHHRSA